MSAHLDRACLTFNKEALLTLTRSTLAPQGTVNLDGGTLRLNTGLGLDRINFNYGTVELTGDRTVGSDATITGLFGAGPTISAREGLKVDGTATLSSALTLDGGTFTAASAGRGDAELAPASRHAEHFESGADRWSHRQSGNLASILRPT